MTIRAGGYVLRGTGWELEAPPEPPHAEDVPAIEADEPDAGAGPAVNVDTGQETAPGDPLPEVEPEVEPLVLLEPEHEPVALEPAETVDFSPYADRAVCPSCGKNVAVNKDGSLRKHQCIEGDE